MKASSNTPAHPVTATGNTGHSSGATVPAPSSPSSLSFPLSPISSRKLLGQQGALHIDHRGAIYTLRATSKGGLILTK